MTTVAMVLLMLSLAFGGSGVTVLAAQDAMPNDPLYGIKLATEDGRVNLESDAQTRAELTLEFALRRMNEIATMANKGIVPPDAVMERQQLQIQNALRDAAGLDDPAMNRILLRTQTMLQEQIQAYDQLRLHGADSVTPVLDRVHEQLRLQLQLTDLGLRDPQQFRTQVRQATHEQSQGRQQTQPKPTSAPSQPTAVQQQQQNQQQQRQSSASAQPTAVQQQNQNQNQQQSQSSAQAQPTAGQQQKQSQSSAQQQNQNQQQSQSSAQTQPTPAQQQNQSGGGSSSASSNSSGRR